MHRGSRQEKPGGEKKIIQIWKQRKGKRKENRIKKIKQGGGAGVIVSSEPELEIAFQRSSNQGGIVGNDAQKYA